MRNLCFNCPYNKGLELGNGCGNDTCIQENMLFEKDEEPVEISCWRAVMEEKERYEYFFGTNTIKDNNTNQFYGCVVDLLNQQDKENKQLKQQLAEKEIQRTHNYYQAVRDRETIRESKISFAVEQLEKVKAELVKLGQDYSLNWCGIKIYNFIDDKINELKEK